MPIIVHTMGVHYRWPIPDVLRSQLRLAHDLREDLVTLQLDHEAAVKAIWSSYPKVAAAEETLTAAEAEATAAAEAVSAERARLRTKRITGPLAERLTAARTEVRSSRQARRDAIAAVRDEATDRITDTAVELRAAQKRLYATYCQEGDLFWATWNDVVDHHKAAVKRVKAQRAAGRPATMRHHRFDGTGSIAVQLQRQEGMPQRTPEVIADPNGKYRNVLLVPWTDPAVWDTMPRAKQRRAGRVTVRMRCGSTGGAPAWIEMPVQQHRMLDADADITGARLTVTRTAGQLTARLTVIAKIGEPADVDDGPTVAVHLGWLDTGTGTRVATWRATTPLDVPFELRTVITVDPGGLTGTVVMPNRVADRIARSDELRSQRDLALDAVRIKLGGWLDSHGPVEHPTRPDTMIAAADVARWRSPARFAALARVWRDSPPPDGDDIADVLEAWRRPDRALWERQEHGRGKALRHRDDLYKQAAAVFSDQAARIVVDDTSVAAIAALPSDLPTEVATRIAHRRTVSAPGTLRAAIVSAATRDGVPVTIVPAAGLTRTHARCGHENPADDRYLTRPVLCDSCGANYDPDASATVLMIQRAEAETESEADPE
jgi:hypothetical protein